MRATRSPQPCAAANVSRGASVTPRRNIERLQKDPTVDKVFLDRIVKLDGAHQACYLLGARVACY